jgi:hypothetical protein
MEVRKLTVDEMLEEASIENYREVLKRIAPLSETEKEVYGNRLSKKLNVTKGAIKKDLKRSKVWPADGGKSPITAYFPRLIDLCVNEEENIAFLILNGDRLEVVPVYEIDGRVYTPPAKVHLPFELPGAQEVLRWAQQGDQSLFEDLKNYLKRSPSSRSSMDDRHSVCISHLHRWPPRHALLPDAFVLGIS